MELALQDTPLGLVPSDWISKTFDDLMSGFSSGQTPPRARPEFYRGNIPWITSGELNYNLITDTLEKITPEALTETGIRMVPAGTFLIAITGLEAEGTRGSCGITSQSAATNQSCMALLPGKDLLLEYLYHFYVLFGERLALQYCQGTKQQSYTAAIVRSLPIVLPPTIAEQQAICEALRDSDRMIEATERLIKKKKKLRETTLQLLFTTAQRLGGFSKPWKTVSLESICETITTGKLDANAMVNGGAYRFYTCAREFYHIDNYAFDTEALIVSGNGSHVGYIHYYKGKFNAYQRTYVLSGFRENIRLVKAFMDMYLPERILTEVNAGSTPYIKMDTLKEMRVHLPTDPAEQENLAALIESMDLELWLLYARLDKHKNMKTAMMQQLLTGRVRLL